MRTEIIKDPSDSDFNYEIECVDGKYFVSKGLLKFTQSFKTFMDAATFIDKHYLSFKKFLEDNNFKTNKQQNEEFEYNLHCLKQWEKINIISEWMGENNAN
jgi:hypothetical protein